MTLLDAIKQKLNEDTRFFFLGKAANEGIWATREKGDNSVSGKMIQLKKNLAQKGYGSFEVYLFKEDLDGVEMRIRMFVPSHCEWDTFFEGFIESESDFDRIMVMLGIK